MAANITEETLKVSYEQLGDLEKEFEENEVEISTSSRPRQIFLYANARVNFCVFQSATRSR